MLLISSERLRQLVPVESAIKAVRQAYLDSSGGLIEQPVRLAVGGGDGLAMLGRDVSSADMVLKAITVRTANPAAGRPAVQAFVLWFDGETGSAQALIEGTALTALRTGAASGVATDLLAPPDARVLAVFGAGGQATDQVRSVCAVRPIREVRLVDVLPDRAARLAERLAASIPSVRFRAVQGAEAALRGADVVCTVTTSTEPLLRLDQLPPEVHVNAIGAYTPAMCELPADLFGTASLVVVDRRDAAMAEAGDLIRAVRADPSLERRLVEIGELLATGRPVERSGRTVFKSVGIAAQDLAVARLAVERAKGSPAAIPAFDF
ncbi:MAG: ornithine cyclodeaminase family protein [Candidatus Limnocylindrales bacterium]